MAEYREFWDSNKRRWVKTRVTRNARTQYDTRKRLIQTRGERCEVCGAKGPVEMHHKNRWVDGGTYDNDNLILLCGPCHKAAHKGSGE
jgi:hypothetical protein